MAPWRTPRCSVNYLMDGFVDGMSGMVGWTEEILWNFALGAI